MSAFVTFNIILLVIIVRKEYVGGSKANDYLKNMKKLNQVKKR